MIQKKFFFINFTRCSAKTRINNIYNEKEFLFADGADAFCHAVHVIGAGEEV